MFDYGEYYGRVYEVYIYVCIYWHLCINMSVATCILDQHFSQQFS